MIKTIPAIVLAVAALAVAGCGGSDSSSGEGAYGGGSESASKPASGESGGGRYGGSSGSAASSAADGAVAVANVAKVGRVLVDSRGYTVYLFEKDQGGKSACYGACAQAWPPLTSTGAPQASGGAMAAKLGTSERKDGSTQVTYAGWPLYTYQGDGKPGEANGNDVDAFGAEWYALTPSGEKAEG